MSQPPFVLPPDGPGSRVRALLAGAGRQRVAVALLALAALLGAGFVWARATPHLAGATTGQDRVAPPDQTLPRAAPDTSAPAALSDEVAVHVAGRVRRPGLVRLPAGSRPWSACRRVLTPRGTLVLVGAPKGNRLLGPLGHILRVRLASLRASQKMTFFISKASTQDLMALRELLEAGTVTPVVERTYALTEAADAFRYLGEGHAQGKLVVTI